MGTGNDQRASDKDRDASSRRLQQAYGEGLIDENELEERLEIVNQAKYLHELEPVLADLQPDDLLDGESAPPLLYRLIALYTPALIATVVWIFTGADGDFWPKWAFMGMTMVALMAIAGDLAGNGRR